MASNHRIGCRNAVKTARDRIKSSKTRLVGSEWVILSKEPIQPSSIIVLQVKGVNKKVDFQLKFNDDNIWAAMETAALNQNAEGQEIPVVGGKIVCSWTIEKDDLYRWACAKLVTDMWEKDTAGCIPHGESSDLIKVKLEVPGGKDVEFRLETFLGKQHGLQFADDNTWEQLRDKALVVGADSQARHVGDFVCRWSVPNFSLHCEQVTKETKNAEHKRALENRQSHLVFDTDFRIAGAKWISLCEKWIFLRIKTNKGSCKLESHNKKIWDEIEEAGRKSNADGEEYPVNQGQFICKFSLEHDLHRRVCQQTVVRARLLERKSQMNDEALTVGTEYRHIGKGLLVENQRKKLFLFVRRDQESQAVLRFDDDFIWHSMWLAAFNTGASDKEHPVGDFYCKWKTELRLFPEECEQAVTLAEAGMKERKQSLNQILVEAPEVYRQLAVSDLLDGGGTVVFHVKRQSPKDSKEEEEDGFGIWQKMKDMAVRQGADGLEHQIDNFVCKWTVETRIESNPLASAQTRIESQSGYIIPNTVPQHPEAFDSYVEGADVDQEALVLTMETLGDQSYLFGGMYATDPWREIFGRRTPRDAPFTKEHENLHSDRGTSPTLQPRNLGADSNLEFQLRRQARCTGKQHGLPETQDEVFQQRRQARRSNAG